MSEPFINAFESLGFQPDTTTLTGRYTKFPSQVKATLVHMTDKEIPVVAGEKVRHLIRGFLTCLDEGEEAEEGE